MEIVVVAQPVVKSRLQGPALWAVRFSTDKLPVKRMANKLKKKRAHSQAIQHEWLRNNPLLPLMQPVEFDAACDVSWSQGSDRLPFNWREASGGVRSACPALPVTTL